MWSAWRCYLDVLQADLILVQRHLDPRLQELLQVTDGLVDVDVLLDEVCSSDGVLLHPRGGEEQGLVGWTRWIQSRSSSQMKYK